MYPFDWTSPKLDYQTNPLGQPIGLDIENTQPRPYPNKASLVGRYCTLHALDAPTHGQGLFNAFALDSEARNWTYLPYGPFDNIAEFTQWLQHNCRSNDPKFFTVLDNASGEVTGMCSYLRIDPNSASIEVGHIHFSPRMQGTRLATEAMYLMMAYVFDDLGYRRYEWKCDALNQPSCRAAERLGFQFEGIFRQATFYKGRNRDTAWFAMTDRDWPTLKLAFDRWLDPNNFDQHDRQRQSLKSMRQETRHF